MTPSSEPFAAYTNVFWPTATGCSEFKSHREPKTAVAPTVPATTARAGTPTSSPISSVRRERCLRVRVRRLRLRRVAPAAGGGAADAAGSSPDAQCAEAPVRTHPQVALELCALSSSFAAARIVTVALPFSALT